MGLHWYQDWWFSLSNLLKSVFLLKNHIPWKYQGTIVAFMMGKGEVYNLFIFVTFIRKTCTNCFFCSRINEFAKQTQGEMGKMAQTRIMLFDISFLMLCHISQVYGLEVNLQLSKFLYMYFFGLWLEIEGYFILKPKLHVLSHVLALFLIVFPSCCR